MWIRLLLIVTLLSTAAPAFAVTANQNDGIPLGTSAPDFRLTDVVSGKQVSRDDFAGGKPSDGKDLRAAMDAVLAGRPVNPDQSPSVGCSIKWKK